MTQSKKKEVKEGKSRVIWITAASSAIVIHTMRIFLDQSERTIAIRKGLGLDINEPVIPILPSPAPARLKLIEQLKDKEVTILAPLLPGDKDSKKYQSVFKDSELGWIHPNKRDFVVNMMRSSEHLSYREAEKIKTSHLKQFKEYFDSKNIHIVES